MKALGLALVVLGSLSVLPPEAPQMCIGAQLAVVMASAQERKLPDGQWCQRATTRMPRGAHACTCHKADCTDDDPSQLPAHTDAACLSYCNVRDCRCPVHDCP